MITSDIPRLSLKQQQHAQQTQQRNQLSTAAISWAEVSRRPDKCREECKQLLGFKGDATTLDRPELLLRSLADIPRLETRLKSMMFKVQLETDMDETLCKQMDDLRAACDAVSTSKELQARG